jgi:hypothetical protein
MALGDVEWVLKEIVGRRDQPNGRVRLLVTLLSAKRLVLARADVDERSQPRRPLSDRTTLGGLTHFSSEPSPVPLNSQKTNVICRR